MISGESIDIGVMDVIKFFAPYIITFIFFILSLHFYWLLGGKRGIADAIPTKENTTEKVFVPSAFSTGVVAGGLLLFGCIEYGNTNVFSHWVKLKYFQWGNVLIGIIFLARAVGDFNYLGFFKRVKETSFAKNDSRFYSPLCLLIAITSLLIVLVD